MSVKDKVIFGLLAVLLAGGGYFQWMASDMKTRMDTLNQNDQEHLDTIDREFREDLRKLNLRFEGRGKHIRKAQEDIIANTDLINQKAAELIDQIEEVQFNLDEYSRITDKKIERTNNNVVDSFIFDIRVCLSSSSTWNGITLLWFSLREMIFKKNFA